MVLIFSWDTHTQLVERVPIRDVLKGVAEAAPGDHLVSFNVERGIKRIAKQVKTENALPSLSKILPAVKIQPKSRPQRARRIEQPKYTEYASGMCISSIYSKKMTLMSLYCIDESLFDGKMTIEDLYDSDDNCGKLFTFMHYFSKLLIFFFKSNRGWKRRTSHYP